MKLPKTTNQQQAILRLIYRHRFLSRTQIQVFMHHKDKRRIIAWLKDLREKQYLVWIYDSTVFVNKSKPAIYYLGLNGIRLLKLLNEYPAVDLLKRYKESARSQNYIDKCILLADCCINLEASSNESVLYTYQLEADYLNISSVDSRYDVLNELKPDIYYEKEISQQKTTYFVYVFEATLPRYVFKKKLKDIVMYVYEQDWQNSMATRALAVHIACESKKDLIYAKRFVSRLLDDVNRANNVYIRFAMLGLVKSFGVTGTIWEEI